MGATLAKLDSNDKIVEIIPQGKKISQDKLDNIKQMYNNYGIIKVRVDSDKLDTFVNEYVSKLLKGNKKLEDNLKQTFKNLIGIGSIMLSINGFILISDVGKNEKFIEGYDNIEHFSQLDKSNSETPDINAQISEVINNNKMMRNLQTDIAIKEEVSSNFKFKNVPMVVPEEIKVLTVKTPIVAQEISQTQNVGISQNIGISQTQNVGSKLFESKFIDIIIPKVYLTSDRVKFLEALFMTFEEKNNTDPNMIFMIKQLDTVLEGLSKGTNPEIKIANIVGLITRGALIFIVVDNFKKLGNNIISKEEQMQFMVTAISELFGDFPSDTCTFYNDKLDFIQFTPNLCASGANRVAQVEQKCPECPVIISETKCPEVTVSETKCPEVTVSETSCPETSSVWKYTSLVLILVLVVLVGYLIWSNRTNIKSGINGLANLSKLSK